MRNIWVRRAVDAIVVACFVPWMGFICLMSAIFCAVFMGWLASLTLPLALAVDFIAGLTFVIVLFSSGDMCFEQLDKYWDSDFRKQEKKQ